MKQIALITGANRGIGFEVSKQLAKDGYHIVMTSRDEIKVKEAASKLSADGFSVESISMDTTNASSISAAFKTFSANHAKLDVLVNNAGGNFDADKFASGMDIHFAQETMNLNLFGPWQTIKTFLPLLKKSKNARIVNVSSGAGSHGDQDFGLNRMGGSVSAYGVSKAALNALTVKLASELKEESILVNSVCPGFTATYPGAEAQGARPVEKGAASVVWAAKLEVSGPTGGFFRDGKPIGW